MARDRERAKQRRAERRSGRGAPDPLDHSSADVDEARLAEAGAVPARRRATTAAREIYADELGDDRERAPTTPSRATPSRAATSSSAEHPRRKRGRVITFLGHCIDELRRVQWPNRRQVGQATAVVLGFVVIAGGYLGLLDALWQPLIEAIL